VEVGQFSQPEVWHLREVKQLRFVERIAKRIASTTTAAYTWQPRRSRKEGAASTTSEEEGVE
jgi:hypothetical protein